MFRTFLTLFVLFIVSCSVDNIEPESPTGPIVRKVKLSNDILAYYGNSDLVKFSIKTGLTPPIHDCHEAILTGVAKNPAANFSSPSNEAFLTFQIYCLQCRSLNGKTFTRRVTGRVEGEKLRGTHMHIYGAEGHQDRFGLSVPAGALGTASILEISTRSCDWLSE